MNFLIPKFFYKGQTKNQGFFALGLVLIIFLSFLPIVHYVGDSLETIGSMNVNYRARIQAENIFKEIKVNLSNYESCFKSFSHLSNSGDWHAESKTMKDFFGKNLSFGSGGFFQLDFRRAVLCFDKNARHLSECKTAQGLLRKNPLTGSTYINEALLHLEVYSEWTDELLEKKIPIFLETDKDKGGKILKCSTSEPALTSEICEAVEVKKSCCRYKFSVQLPERNKLTSKPKELSIAESKGYKKAIGYIPSASDPNNKAVDTECDGAARNMRLKAKCLGSSWDYKVWCVL